MNAFERAAFLRPDAAPPQASGERLFHGELPTGWEQGQATFGGLVLGICASAMQQSEPDATRRLRTLNGDVMNAVKPGPYTVRVRENRRGKLQSNLQATLEQDGRVMVMATSIASGPRPGAEVRFAPELPPALTYAETPELPITPPLGPVFAQHYVYKSNPPYPFSGATEPVTEGFIGEREARQAPDKYTAQAMIGLLDAWWPAYYATMTAPRPTVTVAFLAELLVDPAEVPLDAQFRFRAKVIGGREGYIVELRELWMGDTIVALNQQTFAIVK